MAMEACCETQLDRQSLHPARDWLLGERTALINQLRAFLLERGITVPQGGASWSRTSRPCWRRNRSR